MRLPPAVMLAMLAECALAAEPGGRRALIVEPATPTRLQANAPEGVGRDAWVILEFDVLANGRAANISLVDDGFHERRFVDEATRALRQSRWKPRRVDGIAVDSVGLRQGFRFTMTGTEPGITAAFAEEAKKVEDLLHTGDFEGAEAHARWMLANNIVTRNYEYAVLEAELGQTYIQMGRAQDAMHKLAKATASTRGWPEYLQLLDKPPANKASNYVLEKDLTVLLLGLRMRVLASLGLALEAMQTYYDLAGLQQPAADDPLVALSRRLAEQIRSGEMLRGKVTMGRSSGWRQYLSRPKFMLENVVGTINEMSLNCEAGSRQLEYRPGEEWTVPAGAGLCFVRINAHPAASFEFVEFSGSTTAASPQGP